MLNFCSLDQYLSSIVVSLYYSITYTNSNLCLYHNKHKTNKKKLKNVFYDYLWVYRVSNMHMVHCTCTRVCVCSSRDAHMYAHASKAPYFMDTSELHENIFLVIVS